MPKLTDVYGISTKPILSYTAREHVDGRFADAIDEDGHIVIYGSSKQGKTSLRQKHVEEKKVVVVRCDPTMTPEDIYSAVLRLNGIKIETTEIVTDTVEGKVSTKTGFRAIIPWIGGADAELKAEAGAATNDALTIEFVSFNFSQAQSIGELLNKANFSKFIVLENFHYLSKETQQHLAFDLKTFHEINIKFIILGTWQEANHLITYNTDLEGRIAEIPVEPWANEDFQRVYQEGATKLNIKIEDAIVSNFITNSFGNVGMFQEFLKLYCQSSGVNETGNYVELTSTVAAEEAFTAKLTDQKGQLLRHMQVIAAQCRIRSDESDPLLLPYYLCKVILLNPVETFLHGVHRTKLLELIKNAHHRDDKDTIRGSDLTNLLSGLPRLQKDHQTPFLYYDATSRTLRIVDTRQFFTLSRANGEELFEEIPYPDTRDT